MLPGLKRRVFDGKKEDDKVDHIDLTSPVAAPKMSDPPVLVVSNYWLDPSEYASAELQAVMGEPVKKEDLVAFPVIDDQRKVAIEIEPQPLVKKPRKRVSEKKSSFRCGYIIRRGKRAGQTCGANSRNLHCFRHKSHPARPELPSPTPSPEPRLDKTLSPPGSPTSPPPLTEFQCPEPLSPIPSPVSRSNNLLPLLPTNSLPQKMRVKKIKPFMPYVLTGYLPSGEGVFTYKKSRVRIALTKDLDLGHQPDGVWSLLRPSHLSRVCWVRVENPSTY